MLASKLTAEVVYIILKGIKQFSYFNRKPESLTVKQLGKLKALKGHKSVNKGDHTIFKDSIKFRNTTRFTQKISTKIQEDSFEKMLANEDFSEDETLV